MADTKTTALTAATSWASGDLLYMVRDPAGTPVSRKITVDNILQNLVCAANTSLLKSTTGYSLTGSDASSMIDLAGMWNTTGTPTLIKANVTNTASNAASLLMDLQVGGVSKLKVATTGLVQFVDADVTGMSFTSTGSYGFKYFSLADAGRISMLANSSEVVAIGAGGINIGTNTIGFGANFTTASRDVFLLRDGAANTLALRNGANAQCLNIYGTWTSASVYERAFMRYSVANTRFEIGTEHQGASAKPLAFLSGTSWTFASATLNAPTLTFSGTDRSSTITVQSNYISGAGWETTKDYSAAASSRHAMRMTNGNGATIYCAIDGSAAGVMQVNNGVGLGDGYGAAIEMNEMTAPSAPPTNGVRIYAEDNGSGKTRLMALFASGAAQQISIEP